MERAIARAVLVFWVGVGMAAVLYLDEKGVIPLSQMGAQPRIAIEAALVILLALAFWAMTPDVKIAGLAVTSVARAVAKVRHYRRVTKSSIVAPFAGVQMFDVLHLPCAERRWLVWFLYFDRSPIHYVSYGEAKSASHMFGVHGLLALQILNRAGDEDWAPVFLHQDLASLARVELERNPPLATEIERERARILADPDTALTEELPSYASLKARRRAARSTV